MPLSASPVDPRYTDLLDEEPTYRVDFWTDDVASDEWRIDGASDVHEVLAWADDHANGRSVAIYVETVHEHGIGLARIAGREPA